MPKILQYIKKKDTTTLIPLKNSKIEKASISNSPIEPFIHPFACISYD